MSTKVIYKSYNQNDSLLLPPSLGELISPTHPVRIVSDIIDRIDISEIEETYKGGGTSSYHPRMLLKVVVYGYLCNIYSGRQLERTIMENIHFMWLCGMSRPDFRTLNLFRSNRLSEGRFERIFTRVVELLHSEGLVSLNVQYIDGTKIESCANRYTFVWRGSVEKYKTRLEENIKGVLAEAERILEIENQSDIVPELSAEAFAEKSEKILKKMDECGISDRKLRKDVEKVKDEDCPRLHKYEEHLQRMGERKSYSKTDPDATFMRMKEDAMRNGQTKPGYNVQISTENQYITNYALYWRPTDYGTLIPFLESFKSKYGRQSCEIVADSGYGSEQNYEYMYSESISPYVKYNMFHVEGRRKYTSNAFLPANMYYNPEEDYYVCPMGQHLVHICDKKVISELGYKSAVSMYRSVNCKGCPLRCRCYKGRKDRRTIEVNHKLNGYKAQVRELLTSDNGLYHRSNRPIEPEAVFGDIKFNHNFKRFRLRSTMKTEIEFGLVALAHNLRKYTKEVRNRIQSTQPIPSMVTC